MGFEIYDLFSQSVVYVYNGGQWIPMSNTSIFYKEIKFA